MLSFQAKQRIIDRITTAGVEKASECFEECLKFLSLCADNPGRAFVPSLAVDQAWVKVTPFLRSSASRWRILWL